MLGRESALRTFRIDAKAGDKLALTVQGNNPDCAFLQSDSSSRPLLTVKLTQEATVTLPSSELVTGKGARVSFVAGGSEATQLLVADTTPMTISYNTIAMSSPSILVDAATGVFSFVDTAVGLLTVSAQVVRKTGGSGLANWAMFIEASSDNTTWTAVPGSARRVSLASQEANEYRVVDFTLPVQVAPGTYFRLRHVTDASAKQIGIVSIPAQGNAPSSAGVIVGFYCATKG
ncbi:hypothetical protein ZHX_gp36 [Edwardsiella phage vB_EpP_ZHX]|nr:hypothetical protein ZHX_gp36 [Edwardsiella phage vB_EpP_ZHX]